ncbi:MAG: 2-hydroxyacid dehydrogenase [Gemmatales bacterium]|nr:MAG: 2-hydroxyacid dehydrogenase [Gemmatales bacterium]
MPKVVITSKNAEEGPHHDILRRAGFDYEVAPKTVDLFDEQQVIDLWRDCDAVIAGAEPITRRIIEALPKLRVISRTGVGFDAIDVTACDEKRIVVATTPGVNHHSVAEHTIALLMGVARGFPQSDRLVREGRWQRIARPRVMGSTLGIVGLGRIGQAVATRAVGLGMHVLAYDPFPNLDFARRWNIEMVSFDDLLARSDYVSLHLFMSEENRHLINDQTLAKMKVGSVLINTARGALVDEHALVAALQSGRLRAAALDVFEKEPLPLDSPLLQLPNVLLSGHVAGLDQQSHEDTYAMAANTIVDLYEGRWPAERIQNLKGVNDWKW